MTSDRWLLSLMTEKKVFVALEDVYGMLGRESEREES